MSRARAGEEPWECVIVGAGPGGLSAAIYMRHPSFFAAGDVTDKHSHQVVSAAHEGSMAGQAANHVLYPPRQRL